MLQQLPNSSRKGMATINANNVAKRSDLLIRPSAILNQYANGIQQYAYGGQPTMRSLDFGEAGVGAATGALSGAAAGTLIFPGIGTAIGAAVGAIGGFLAGVIGDDTKRKKELEAAKARFEEQIVKEENRADEIKKKLDVTGKPSEGAGYYMELGSNKVPNVIFNHNLKPIQNGK